MSKNHMNYLYISNNLIEFFSIFLAIWKINEPDISHHNVHKRIFYKTEEHEEGTGRHKHIYRLNIKVFIA